MCECIHRAGTRKISLKNVASTPAFRPFDWQCLLTNERDRPYGKAKVREHKNHSGPARRVVRAGRNKTVGKFSRLKAFARSIAALTNPERERDGSPFHSDVFTKCKCKCPKPNAAL
jgi:hypothetical protein